MTREEAKEILTHNWTRVDNPNYSESELDEAFFMAIEALSTPSGDTISRADAIKAIRKCKFESDMPSYWYRGMENAQDIIENIPSTELPKGDLISRKVLMDRLESFCKWCKDGRLQGAEFVWDCIVPNVPSADANQTNGRLIDADALMDLLKERKQFFVDSYGGFHRMSEKDKARCDEIDACIASIVNAPTVSADADVVRCKDCKQRRVEGNCTNYYYCDFLGSICGDNEYCSFGERREP